jgi:short-subunit dehydrogenase
MINTNLYSAYHLTRGLLPIMMKAGSGDIVNICSIASIMPYANGGSYSISKYAMLGMTKVLREEMKQHGIRVMAVLPGATYTSSWEGAEIPETRFMKAEDVADAVFGACALSRNSVVEEVLIRPAEGDFKPKTILLQHSRATVHKALIFHSINIHLAATCSPGCSNYANITRRDCWK